MAYLLQEFYQNFLNFEALDYLDNAGKRKGKLVEKRGRKATGLKPKSHDSRVAETDNIHISFETL